jgi:hypothetical protein
MIWQGSITERSSKMGEVDKCISEYPMPGNIGGKGEMSRQRFLELTALAVKACQELEAHGLKREEYCVFGRIVEQVSRLK